MFKLVLVSTQLFIKWVSGVLAFGVKWLGCQAEYSLPSSMEFKNEWNTDITYLYLLCNRRENEVMEVMYGCTERQLQYHTHIYNIY